MPETLRSISPAGEAHDPLRPGDRLDERFEITRLHDTGGWAQVYHALDFDVEPGKSPNSVAVKLLRPLSPVAERRVQREILALSRAHAPGLVRMVHHGRHQGRLYLALEWIDGHPLTLLPWSRLQPIVESLLRTLAALHGQGIVHRDIKPSNILFDPARGPVLVDLGLATGAELGGPLTRIGEAVGTEQYAAPEQLRGQPVDGRADLYALGVTIYELLTGRLPHRADTREALIGERLSRRPTPVEQLVALPRGAAALVDRLLRVDPAERPSAREALRLLGADAPPEESSLPWMGGPERVAQVTGALAPGALVRIGGAGCGRTRLLEEVAGADPEALWLPPGDRPYASLRVLAEDPDFEADEAQVVQRLRQVLARAPLLLADPWERLDPWSRALLETAPPAKGLLASAGQGATLSLPPLTEADLRQLFDGPDLLLHLGEDAARELHRRTGGRATAVSALTRAWRLDGTARLGARGLRLDRTTLDRLRADDLAQNATDESPPQVEGRFESELLGVLHLCWPHTQISTLRAVTGLARWELEAGLAALSAAALAEPLDERWRPRVALALPWTASRLAEARAALARATPPGSPGRLHLLLALESQEGLIEEALATAARRERDGMLGEAIGDLQTVWSIVDDPRPLLAPLLRVLLARGRPVDRAQALRAALGQGEAALVGLVEAISQAEEGDRTRALWALRSMAPLADPGLEMRRLAQIMRAARDLSLPEQEALLMEMASHALVLELPASRAQWSGWVGLLRYRQRRFREAAEQHEIAASEPTRAAVACVVSLVNAGRSWLEAGDLDAVERIGALAASRAAALRHPAQESQAHWLLRAAANRRGAVAPDLALAEAMEAVDQDPVFLGAGLLTEAYIAARGGHPATESLARRALAAFNRARNAPGALSAEAIAATACGAVNPELATRAAAPSMLKGHPEVALDVLALHAPGALGSLPPKARACLETLVGDGPCIIRGLLPAGEALRRLAHRDGTHAMEW